MNVGIYTKLGRDSGVPQLLALIFFVCDSVHALRSKKYVSLAQGFGPSECDMNFVCM